MPCRIKKGSFYISCTERPLVGWKLWVSPSYWGPNCAITGGYPWLSAAIPLPASLQRYNEWSVNFYVRSDFQTPGLPCSGGRQHVLVPQVAEESHLVTRCDPCLTSLCVSRQANIFTPLHHIFLALSCQELNMKYLPLVTAHRAVFTAMLLVLVIPGQACGIRKTSVKLNWCFNSRFSMYFAKKGSPREKGMKTQFSEIFDTDFSSSLATGSCEGAIRASFKGNTHGKAK